jgi:hypothetical protein
MHGVTRVPESAFPNSGEGLKLTFLKMKCLIQRFKAVFNIIGCDHIGGQFVSEGIDIHI